MSSFSSLGPLFDNIPIGLFRTLAGGEMVAANAALAEILGFVRAADLIGTNVVNVYLRPEDRRRIRRQLEEKGGVGGFDVELRRRGGDTCWVRISAREIRDVRGDVAYYEGAVEEIGDVHRLEEALRASEAQYRILFESCPQAMGVIDQGTLRFLAVNAAAQKCYGYAREEFLAMSVLDIRPHEDQARLVESIMRSNGESANGDPQPQGIWCHLCKDGTEVWAEIVSARILFGGREAILIAGTDVTERIRAEHEREAASRQIVLAQEREQRSIARELHDQIGQMLTALKLMLDTSDQRGHLGRKGLAEAQGLVHQLMERVRGLTLNLRPPALDRFGLLPALLGLVERFTPLQVDFVHCGLERRFSSEIETAAFRIVQEALTNIARHAAVHRAVVRVHAGEDALTLQVEDMGVGFDVERASTVHGTAGLIGMRERASAFGGQLTIESSPGCGTKIHAELPIDGEGQKYDDDGRRREGR